MTTRSENSEVNERFPTTMIKNTIEKTPTPNYLKVKINQVFLTVTAGMPFTEILRIQKLAKSPFTRTGKAVQVDCAIKRKGSTRPLVVFLSKGLQSCQGSAIKQIIN